MEVWTKTLFLWVRKNVAELSPRYPKDTSGTTGTRNCPVSCHGLGMYLGQVPEQTQTQFT